ncbi:MAG TPA: hypothetical protein VIV60_18810, partial [Polyangiaceae bacterium]
MFTCRSLVSYAVSFVWWGCQLGWRAFPRTKAAPFKLSHIAYVWLIVAGCGEQVPETVPLTESAITKPIDVWTQHYDNARTGATLSEVALSTSNVNVTTFGKLFTRAVDGPIY